MKNISPAMKAHLKQDATTITTMWKVTRMDGKVFGFTEHDTDIIYNGQLYKSDGGFNKSAIKNSGTLAVDNLEVNGYLTDDTIEDTELRNGAFDYALVEIFAINYRDHSMGDIKLRYGYFGEVKTTPSGAFVVELRGLVQLLAQKIGETYTPECRADLGDARCKVQVDAPERVSNKQYYVGDRIKAPIDLNGYYPPIDAPAINTSFEQDDLGWGRGYYTSVSTGTVRVKPYKGTKFARISNQSPLLGVWYGSTTLITADITPARILKGDLKLATRMMLNSLEEGQEPRILIKFRNAANQVLKQSEHLPGVVSPPHSWIAYVFYDDIPPTAASIEYEFYCPNFPAYGMVDLGIDEVRFQILREAPPNEFQKFGGIEFECTQTGVSANTIPEFDPTINAETIDGTVKWVAKTPNHMFLDQVAVDATDSSTLVLTSSDKPDGWFDWGVIKILTGENAGFAVEAVSWVQATKTLKLAMPIPRKTLAGTAVQLITGCDKSREDCRDKFDNLFNFRGEPDIPGVGQYFKVAGLA